jgi:hypothetical protein
MTNRFRDGHPLMGALAKGLPVTLLIDLVDPNGPRSHEMYEREGIGSDDRAAAAPTTARTA